MSGIRVNCFLALLLAIVEPAFCADQWLRINSANFELFTTAGEKKGREAILYFEQVRALFAKLAKSSAAPSLPVRIIAFQSDKEFGPYRINAFAAAYYLGNRDRDYIVMKSIAPESYPVAIHEYSHLIVKHSGLDLPVWLNEGLAEVLSTMKPYLDKVRLGDIPVGRYQELQTGKWLPLETLTRVDHQSPLYNEKQKAGVFYAESWALTHMLYFSNDYWQKFPEFLSLVKPGDAQAGLLEQIYGKPISKITDDLRRYMTGTQFNGGLADVKLEKSSEAPDVRPATALESSLALADLLAITRKRNEATAAYEALARDYPKDPQIPVAMARLAWMNSDHEGMKRNFARAIELGTTNAKVYFDYAMMLRAPDASNAAEVMPLLRKAADLQPDLQEANYFLGFYAMNASQFGEAVARFNQVKKLEKEQAFPFFRAVAYAYYRLGLPEEARKHAESAVKYAADPKDALVANELLAYVTRDPSKPAPAPPDRIADDRPRLERRDDTGTLPAQIVVMTPTGERLPLVEGTLQQVDCLDAGARLRILTGGKQMAFLIDDPVKVMIKGPVAGGTYDFTCGPQNSAKVALEYVVKPDSRLGIEGLVRSLEFR